MSEKNYFETRPLKSIDGELHFDGTAIKTYLSQYQTPFYLYSRETLKTTFNQFKAALEKRGVSDYLICYALKANPRRELVSILGKCGAGADIVSGGELEVALAAHIPSSRVVFSGVGKTPEELERAMKCGVYSLNIESFEEWQEASEIASRLGVEARASLRFNPMVESNTHKHISTGARHHKFGMSEEDIFEIAKTQSSHLQLKGLSVHIGSQLMDLHGTKEAVIKTCALIKELEKIAGAPFEFIDVGGGLAVDYEPGVEVPALDEYLDLVVGEIKKGLGRLPKLVFEPGRFLVAKSGVLVTKVLRRKKTGEHHFLIVDAGMNDFARSSLYGAYHHLLPVVESAGERRATHVVGPICETTDSFATGRDLSAALKKDDYLVVCDTGAYGESMASTYNCRELVKGFFSN